MLRFLAFAPIAFALLFSAPATAFDSSGLGDPICFLFFFNGVKLNSGTATSPITVDYNFVGQGQIGVNGRGCASGPDDKVEVYPVAISGNWDGNTKRAKEVITHKSAGMSMVTEIAAQCADDPWISSQSCTAISQRTVRADGYDVTRDLTYDGMVPMSAMILGPSGRALVAHAVSPYQKFVLAPTTPPIIKLPLADLILRRGQALQVNIQRPSDGNAEWYASHSLSFDLEWQVRVNPSPSADPKYALSGPLWNRRPILTSIDREGETRTVPNSALYSGDTASFFNSGGLNTWRLRARVHDDVVVRPWSEWVAVFSEPPYSVAPGVHGPDRLGGAPAPMTKLPPVAPGPVVPGTPAAPGVIVVAPPIAPPPTGTIPMAPGSTLPAAGTTVQPSAGTVPKVQAPVLAPMPIKKSQGGVLVNPAASP